MNPHPLSERDWTELASIQVVADSFGLDAEPTEVRGSQLARAAYGVRFDFVSGSPGYVGDMYIVHGDYLSAPPLVFTRDGSGRLELVDYSSSQ